MFGGLTLLALWFVLCRHLSGEWSVNEQYNYGWFVPFFAAYLFWLRWEHGVPGVRPVDGSTALGSGAEAGTLEHQARPEPRRRRDHETTGQRDTESVVSSPWSVVLAAAA